MINELTEISIKENDVFKAQFTEKHRNGNGKGWDLHHAFEGLLVAKTVKYEGREDRIMLFDCYWGVGDTSGKHFDLQEIGEVIDIKFYCNLDKVEKSPKGSRTEYYYHGNDYFVLTRQHGCSENCKEYFIRKGATYSKEKIIASISSKIKQEEQDIERAKYTIKRLNEDLEKVFADNFDVYI